MEPSTKTVEHAQSYLLNPEPEAWQTKCKRKKGDDDGPIIIIQCKPEMGPCDPVVPCSAEEGLSISGCRPLEVKVPLGRELSPVADVDLEIPKEPN